MKKFLSLVLALVMTMSLVTVAGAADFTDDTSVNYNEAVDVISALEIVGGYADGSFNPEGTLTRGAAAKIICNILVGPKAAAELEAETAPFVDVPVNHTFAGYIAYCVNEGIISGYTDGTFKPGNTLTGYAFAKMLMTALGYDQEVEGFVGTNATVNIALAMKALKTVDGDDAGDELDSWTLLEGFEGTFVGSKAITREQACLLALNAMLAMQPVYEESGNNITIGDIVISASKKLEAYTDQLYTVNFENLCKKADETDEFGRTAYYWYINENNTVGFQASKDTKIGTYAEKADYVIENKLTAKEWKNLVEDLDLKSMKGLTAADTANGKTIELFFNDDADAVASYVDYAAVLVGASKTPDLASTKDKDERTITFAGFSAVVADDEVKTGTEIKNFDEAYKALEADKNQKFLVVESNKTAKKVVSVEIPEVIEGKISRVDSAKGTIVVDGETYMYDSCTPTIGEAKLTVGANGVVYAVEAAGSVSDVIFVNKVFSDDDKWGNYTVTAQIVNEEYEIVDVTIAQVDADESGIIEVDEVVLPTEGEYYVYDVEDDEYTLTLADAEAVVEDTKFADWTTTEIDDEDKYVTVAGKKVYFAADMTVVFMEKVGTADLKVTVKEGAQNIAKDLPAAYILNADKDIAVLYVESAPAAVSEDVLYINDTAATPVANLEGKTANAYTVYMNGVEEEIMISNTTVAKGFYTYELNEKTGEYKLITPAKYADTTELTVGAEGGVTVNKDGTVDFGALTDIAVTGEIVDLTEEGLVTTEILGDWTEDEGYTIKVSFVYDDDAEAITMLYVVSAVAPETETTVTGA